MKRTIFIIIIGFSFALTGHSYSYCLAKNTPNTAYSQSHKTDTVIHSSPKGFIKELNHAPESQKINIRSYKEVLELFDKLDYTSEAWQAGIRKAPRVYFTRIGKKWGATTTKNITVLYKKKLFFRGIAPLILLSNENILKDRNRLKEIKSSFTRSPLTLSEEDIIWTINLAKLYKVKSDGDMISEPMIAELWKRVDIIPPSLALSQAAIESGWGTSRFASSGNAVYGQWTWGKKAMLPEQQREELGNYGIAAFGSLFESVCAYMLNLNTHNAYAKLREKRAEARRNGDKIKGYILAEQLDKYSERGESYVTELKSLMDYNHLNPVDDAYLYDSQPIYLIPVAE